MVSSMFMGVEQDDMPCRPLVAFSRAPLLCRWGNSLIAECILEQQYDMGSV